MYNNDAEYVLRVGYEHRHNFLPEKGRIRLMR
jgi:hypothetical protein